jgi:hypothetical protein
MSLFQFLSFYLCYPKGKETMSELKISLPAPTQADPVVGKGVVISVNEPGNPNTKTFTIQNGDRVEMTRFKPKDADAAMPDLGIAFGLEYTASVVTHADNTQAFFVWSVDTPDLQDRMEPAATTVHGIGTTNQPIMRGDVFAIRTGNEDGGLGVTFDIYRGNSAIATFSFVVKK